MGAALYRAGLPTSTPAGNPRGSNYTRLILPGTNTDYARKAGDLWLNSVVMSAIGWIGRNIHQAPLASYRKQAGASKPVPFPHAIETLLARPNPYYSYQVLMASTLLSLILSGNAYWYIVRDPFGLPKQLWWIPHTVIEPAWEASATTDNWVSDYAYWNAGILEKLPFENVIHFREGALDPRNPRKSLSQLNSALRQVATDNEIETYNNACISNLGVPGIIASPDGDQVSLDVDKTKEVLDDRIGGDNRGSTVVFDVPTKLDILGMSPEDMLLTDTSQSVEARICSLIGINPVVLALPVGLEHSTFNNQEEARAAAWEDGIVPRLKAIAGEVTLQLCPLYEDGLGLTVAADLSEVRALAPSQDALFKRLSLAVGGPFMGIEEAREMAGLPAATEDQLAKIEAKGKKIAPADPAQTGDNVNA